MKHEIYEAKGRLVKAKNDLEILQIEAAALQYTIRAHLSPFEKDITKIDVKTAKVAMDRLIDIKLAAEQSKSTIIELEDFLGAL